MIGIANKIFAKEFQIPNPLWWIVGYAIVYPARKIRRAYRTRNPIPKEKNYCQGCGRDEGESLWGFCSPECLEIIHAKNQANGKNHAPN